MLLMVVTVPVSVINTTTNPVDPTPITVGSAPYGIAYDYLNQRMYVTNGGDRSCLCN